MPIKRYDHDETKHKPKMLEGIKELKPYIVQATDEQGKPFVLIGFDIGDGEMSFLPIDTWQSMKPAQPWLKPQLKKWFEERKGIKPPPPDKKTGQVSKVKDLGNEEV